MLYSLKFICKFTSVFPVTQAKEGDVSVSNGNMERIPLLADMVLYYCRNADQPVLVQLYQAEVRGAPHTHTHIHTHTHTHKESLNTVNANVKGHNDY